DCCRRSQNAAAKVSNPVPAVQPTARAWSQASSSARADAPRAGSSTAHQHALTAVAPPASGACRIAGRIPGPADSPPGTSDSNEKSRAAFLEERTLYFVLGTLKKQMQSTKHEVRSTNTHKILARSSYPTNPRRHNVSATDTAGT